MTVLIDSGVWIEYFAGSERGKHVKGYMEAGERIILSTINIAEVFRFILAKFSKKDAETAVDHMLKTSFVVPVSIDIAIEAAKIKHARKWGLGDSLILATAMKENASVVTADRDFQNEKSAVFLD